MISRLLILNMLLVILASCASNEEINEDPTIQQLAKRAAKIEPTALPAMTKFDVKNTYESLAKSTSNESLKAIALQRLADLELETKQEAIARGQLQTGDTSADNKGNAADDTQGLSSAISQYERLLELYPDYDGNDKVLYQLGRAYELNGDMDKTLGSLTRLIKEYPQQKNRDEIQFRRGEILFSFKDFKEAEEAYQDVINIGEN
ncbi:tetratricopeptide repeat protein, partial [Kaarinaea lacus]